MSNRVRKMKMRDFRKNKVVWPLNNDYQLDKCEHEKKIVPIISQEGLKNFREEVNDLILVTRSSTAPMYLQFGGQVVALIIAIIGVVALAYPYIVIGVVLLILAFLFSLFAFWYRQQLINKSWKRVGQGLTKVFKDMTNKFPGVSYEFHVQGIHERKVTKGETEGGKKKKKKKKKKDSVFAHSRYITIYLPGDQGLYHDFQEDKRSPAEIVHGDSHAVYAETDVVGTDPLVLPYWWAIGKTRDGRRYYINNLKHRTQWNPPTEEQIALEEEELNEVLAPPQAGDDDMLTDESSDEESS